MIDLSSVLSHFFDTLGSTVRDVLPIVIIIFGFQLAVLRRPVANWDKVVLGFVYVVLGLSLFLMGLELALFPLGESMAAQLTALDFLFESGEAIPAQVPWEEYYWVYLFSAAIGFSTTVAEPSLIAVAIKANQVSGGTIKVNGLRISVALGGVSFGIALGSYRIVAGDPLHYYILAGYIVVVVQTYFAPKTIVPLAYDSGGGDNVNGDGTDCHCAWIGVGIYRTRAQPDVGWIWFDSICQLISDDHRNGLCPTVGMERP